MKQFIVSLFFTVMLMFQSVGMAIDTGYSNPVMQMDSTVPVNTEVIRVDLVESVSIEPFTAVDDLDLIVTAQPGHSGNTDVDKWQNENRQLSPFSLVANRAYFEVGWQS